MDNKPQPQKDATIARVKPAVPKKPDFVLRSTHVRHVVQKLEEKGEEREIKGWKKRNGDENVAEPEASKQTLEDLKAIDEDLEKLRKQIEERDKIIGALREAAEAKDKKLESLSAEFSKLQSGKKIDLDTCPETSRTNSSSPSSPPLCKGGLCWTDSFVTKNYHEPIYAQLLNDHTNLRKIYNNLCNQLEIKGGHLEDMKMKKVKAETQENAINLIMMEQIRILKEREAQLIWEAEELREQNDLMEFRILELEECRKEFLDREAEDEKRQKAGAKWNERDLEEVSDSGVVSLPTSEDLNSDSELGEAIRNYSPLGAGAFTSLSAESFQTEVGSGKKSECLQESGIFVESEVSGEISSSAVGCLPSKRSKGCQTEFLLDKAILDIIDSSYDFLLSKNPELLEKNCFNPKSNDLTTEISKLSVIQERIRQKTNTPIPHSNPQTIFTCPHSSSLLFYEDRLRQLESKIQIYESSGDTKDVLLAKRLEKEVELSYKVKELTQKVANLELINKKLEEEKCEFEEAENDTRFQCQRLNTRLQELLDKNTELELELERQKIIMSEERRREKKRESLHGLISQYEQRNFELEEKEVETKQRLSMMEAAMPAIVAWNVFQTMQNPELVKTLSGATNTPTLNQSNPVNSLNSEMFQRIEELVDDQKQLRKECEKVEETVSDREKMFRDKIQELETKSAKDRETLEEMTKSLKSLKHLESYSSANHLRPEEIDLFEELKHMIANEIQLRAEIEQFEKKEQAYMQSLDKADDIWAGMEAEYKRRLAESELVNADLQKRISQLEATQLDLEKALQNYSQPKMDTFQIETELRSKIEFLMKENENLKVEISKSLTEKFEEQKKFLEAENYSLKKELQKMKEVLMKEEERYLLVQKKLELAEEEAKIEKETGAKLREEMENRAINLKASETKLQSQISELTHQLFVKSKELMGLEVTVSELREEVETLEKRVAELMKAMRSTSSSHQEEGRIQTQEKSLYQVVSFNSPKLKVNFEEQPRRKTPESLPFGEKQQRNPVAVQSFRSKLQSVLFPVFVSLRQESRFLFSFQNSAKQFLIKSPQSSFENLCVMFAEHNSKKTLESQPQDEIFRLSLENTELQQTLEKMEEESRLKSKEIAELQKIAMEIRKEQKLLESIYDIKNRKDIVKTEDKEVQKHLEPELPEKLDKDKDRATAVEKEPSLLRKVADNSFPDADRGNDRSQMKEFVQIGDSCNREEAGDRMQLKRSQSERNENDGSFRTKKAEMERSMSELKSKTDSSQRKSLSTRGLAKTSSATCSMLFPPAVHKSFPRETLAVDSELSFAPAIKTVRKVGDDGLFLEWDVTHQPPSVTGFEINVNGSLAHRVRSSSRNKALLHPLNLSQAVSIQLFATSESGRFTKGSEATFLNENCSMKASAGNATSYLYPV